MLSIIRGGTIYDPANGIEGDVGDLYIEDGRIVAPPADTTAAQEIDARGKLVMAGAIEAKRLCQQEVVTVALREVVFKEPVFVGDLVSLYTRIIATGRTSITTEVTVISFREGACCMVTTAQVTYVSIDANRKAIPIEIRRSQIDPPAFSQEYLQDKLEMATPAAPQAGT